MAGVITQTADPLQIITITYIPSKPITEAVYLAGSFTAEPWLPVKMDKSSHHGEDGAIDAVKFTHEFQLRPGKYQYKYRIGEADCWMCDERHEIVKDEQGNSNNLLTVHSPGEEDSSSSKSPESALGTWNPDQELSPMHRRASTNLGVRISRMGTFLPPEEDEDEDEHLVVPPAEVAPVDLETRLHDIEQEEADSDETSSAEGEMEATKEHVEEIRGVTTMSTTGTHDHEQHVSSLDRIAESPPEPFEPASENGLADLVHWKASGKAKSYGTLDVNSPTKPTVSSTSVPSTPSTTLHTPLLKDYQASDQASVDGNRDNDSENSDRRSPRGLVIFVLLAAWFRDLWKRLFGARSAKHDDAQGTTN